MGDALRDLRPIAITVAVDNIVLPPREALSVGLIVNELVMNAMKYAFPEERGGTVSVGFQTIGNKLVLAVTDDGIGCPANSIGNQGLGRRIIGLLCAELEGSAEWHEANPGCRIVAQFPASPRYSLPSS